MNNLQVRENEARQIIASQMSVLRTLTGKDEVKSSTFASAILAQVTNKSLADCKIDDIIKNGIEIVRLGLNPNPKFGHAYIVPFKLKNKKTGEVIATIPQLQIGYKGLIALAKRSGWRFRAECVFKCDEFKLKFGGVSDEVEHIPNFEARQDDNAKWIHENLIGVVVYVADSENFNYNRFVHFSKLEKLRLKSENQSNPNELNYIWKDWSEEMYNAKALKYVATRLPITEQIQNAINSENAVYSENANLTQNNGLKTQNEAEVIETIDLNQIALNEPLKSQEIEAEIISDDDPVDYFDEVSAKLEKASLNDSIKNYVLNSIRNNRKLAIEFYSSDEKLSKFIDDFVEKENAERKAMQDQQKKAFKVGYTGDKLKLFQLLISEKGLTDDEAIGLIQQFAPTGTLAKALLENGERLENAISEYFNLETKL